ncbi:MAG: response regulator transcription factor [Limnohabitans sp.]|nr:response regulator transcription factor [Limnohabitans sp.]
MNKIKIAIVDDHKMFTDGLRSVFMESNIYEILFVANNAQEALIALSKNDLPDLIISDISMPEMNGFEFIKIVKETYSEIKVLVISMFDTFYSNDQIDGYLLKDASTETIFEAIQSIVINNKKYFSPEVKIVKIDTENQKNILTSREKEIIQLIAQEYTSDEIAEKLFLSKLTVETHRKNILIKLQVKNVAGLIKKAIIMGIVK